MNKYSRKLTDYNRQNIVRLVLEGGDTAAVKKQVAAANGVCLKTIYNVMKAYHENCRTNPIEAGGRPKTFEKSDMIIIRNISAGDSRLVNS